MRIELFANNIKQKIFLEIANYRIIDRKEFFLVENGLLVFSQKTPLVPRIEL